MEVDMCRSLVDYIRLVAAYLRINLNAQLAYRGAFFSEAIAMFVNNGAWVLFWVFFFTRFPVLRGWSFKDVVSLWAISASGYGIAYCFMGNAHRQLASAIANGELDMWLLHPRAVLPHLVLGRTIPSAWGDWIFGYSVYLVFVRPDVRHMAMFVVLSLTVAMVFVGLGIIAGSLSFYVGNAGTMSDQWRDAVITFATHPPALFDGAMKVILFTVIPAGFVSYLPVATLKSMSMRDLFLAVSGAVGLLVLSAGIFYNGLRRYESGNLISMNG
jgi:ABC-2 type transport system permease protein